MAVCSRGAAVPLRPNGLAPTWLCSALKKCLEADSLRTGLDESVLLFKLFWRSRSLSRSTGVAVQCQGSGSRSVSVRSSTAVVETSEEKSYSRISPLKHGSFFGSQDKRPSVRFFLFSRMLCPVFPFTDICYCAKFKAMLGCHVF